MSLRSLKSTSKKAKRRPSLRRFILFIMGLILAALIAGFIIFAYKVSKLEAPQRLRKADGIVVWTGKGGDRVAASVNLLQKKYGERLLISGTNPELSRETILKTLGLPDSMADCCVDMDRAENTIDNARQTANWAQALGYDHIILVTSAYHMPRAEIEIGSAAQRLGITAYPVRDLNAKPWWKDSTQFSRLLREYGKLILSFIRNKHIRGTPPVRLETQNSVTPKTQ